MLYLLSTFIVKLASKIGKKELSMIGCFISAASFILLFIIHTHNVWVWVGLIIVATIGTSMFNMVIWAMITDVIDESEGSFRQESVRMEQFIQYIHLQESLDRLVSSGLSGALLSIIGYTSVTAFDPKGSRWNI